MPNPMTMPNTPLKNLRLAFINVLLVFPEFSISQTSHFPLISHDTCFTGGILQLPSMTDGGFSFGQ